MAAHLALAVPTFAAYAVEVGTFDVAAANRFVDGAYAVLKKITRVHTSEVKVETKKETDDVVVLKERGTAVEAPATEVPEVVGTTGFLTPETDRTIKIIVIDVDVAKTMRAGGSCR